MHKLEIGHGEVLHGVLALYNESGLVALMVGLRLDAADWQHDVLEAGLQLVARVSEELLDLLGLGLQVKGHSS